MILAKVLTTIAEDINARRDKQRGLLVAIDGPDGSGKSRFAENLATHLLEYNVPVLHISIDGFHYPRAKRYEQGRHSPEGFFYDSYDYDAFKSAVLLPFATDSDRNVRVAIHNVETDERLSLDPVLLRPGTVLVVDGMFLHRDELRRYWDYSIYLDVDFQQTFRRMAVRDGLSPDSQDEANRRYREGQLLYFKECNPADRATVVIDNSNFDLPEIISRT